MVSLSVITICYNCRDEIPGTVETVQEQTHDDIEHIVVDGDSDDGTAEWLGERQDAFDILISEPDDGRYDAMNKGLDRATGDYVIFLNAGDQFASPSAVRDILTDSTVESEHPTIVSGQMELTLNGEQLGLYRPWEPGKEGPGLPHPATMIDREVHQANPYDESFRFCGDYELWARLRSKDLYDVHYVDNVLTLFDVSGASNAPEAAYSRYLERAFVDHTYGDTFGATEATKLLVIPVVRQLLSRGLGQRRFITVLRYRRLLKRRIRERSKP